MLYEVITMLVIAVIALGSTFLRHAPDFLTIGVPAVFVLMGAVRLLVWNHGVITSYSIHYTKLYEEDRLGR